MLLCTLNFNFFMSCSYHFSGFFRFCRRGFNTSPVSSKLSEDKPFLFCSFRLFDTRLVSKDTLQLAFFYLLWGKPSLSESLRKSSGSISLSKLLSAFSGKVSLNSQEKDKSTFGCKSWLNIGFDKYFTNKLKSFRRLFVWWHVNLIFGQLMRIFLSTLILEYFFAASLLLYLIYHISYIRPKFLLSFKFLRS